MAATAPKIDMTMISRVLGPVQKSKARVAAEERQRLVALASTGPVSITLPTHRIGQTGMLDFFGTMGVWVTVLDVRSRGNKVEARVTPQSGAGEAWVSFDTITSWAVPVPPAKE